MSYTDTVQWAQVEEAASKMFNVWIDGTELDWAKEAWTHMLAAGLVNATTVLDATAANLRLVTLAVVYQEFCGLAWDENAETPLDYLAENLEIDPVALGILAAKAKPDEFEDLTEAESISEAAVIAVTDSQREEVFECLRAAYGDEFRLYSRLWHTRLDCHSLSRMRKAMSST